MKILARKTLLNKLMTDLFESNIMHFYIKMKGKLSKIR